MVHDNLFPSLLLLPLLLGTLSGCDTSHPLPTSREAAWMGFANMVPHQTAVTVFAPRSEDLHAWQNIGKDLGLAQNLVSSCDHWRAHAPISPCDPERLRAAQVLPDTGVHLGWSSDFLTFSVFAQRPQRVIEFAQNKGWSAERQDDLWTLSNPKTSTQAIAWVRDGFMLWHVTPKADAPRARALMEKAKSNAIRRGWTDVPRHREIVQEVDNDHTLYGSVQVEHAARTLHAPNPNMARLRAQLTQGMDTVGWEARMDGAHQGRVNVYTSEKVSEPTATASIDATQGALPKLGHMIPPGTLGVVRASVDPVQLEALIQSMLTPQDRQTLETFEQRMLTEFAVPIRKNVIENIQGHAVAVLYGIDPQAWKSKSWIEVGLKVLMLEGTKEAVLVPLKDAKLLRDVLDALTALTKGRLVRQGVEHGVHYAWMVKGELKWAMVVYDDAVIILDSAAAFTRANAQAQKAQKLDPSWKSMELETLLEGTNKAGMYVDIASLRALLPAPHAKAMLPWLRGLDRVTIVSQSTGRTARTEALLKFAPKQP
jgi:hypothetical protein